MGQGGDLASRARARGRRRAYIPGTPTAWSALRRSSDGSDMTMGGGLACGIVLLTLMHWGSTLTSSSRWRSLFLLRPAHPTTLFAHPGTTRLRDELPRPGVTQGFFLYAQTAADDIFFLVMYATTLFGLGMMPMIVEAWRLVGGNCAAARRRPAVPRQRPRRRGDGNRGIESRAMRAFHDSR
jgi:hypothetical protein